MSTSLKEHPTVAAHRQRPAPEKASLPLDAAWLRQLCLEAGSIRPVIDRVFPFDQAKEALAYLEKGRAKGKVVVQIR